MRGQLAVIVPAYNAAAHITETLQSIIAQSLRPDEVIVVDDGSTDGTAEVASAVDSGIRVIRQRNGGAGAARNVGILASQSEYVATVDADDLLLEDHFKVTTAALTQHPEVPVAFGDVLEFTDQGFYSESFWQKTNANHRDVAIVISQSGVQLLGDGLTAALFRGNIVPVSTTVIRRSAFAKAGLCGATLRAAEDQDLNLRLSRLGPFAYVGKVTAHKRVHEQSLTVQANVLVWAEEGLRVLAALRILDPGAVYSDSAAAAMRTAVQETAATAFYQASLQGIAALRLTRRKVRELGWRIEPSIKDWARAALRNR